MNRRPVIYFHADDYGMTPPSNARIEDCWKEGLVNSVSIMPNGNLAEAIPHLSGQGLRLAVHLNLVEGKALSPAGQTDLLTGPDGSFRHSFGGLLKLSLSPQRKRFREQVYQELRLQLLAVAAALPPGEQLCVDSHQHTHMIPLIFHTLLQVITDCRLPIGAIRIPAEPISPFLCCPSLYRTYSPLNLVKQLVLKGLYLFDRPAHRRSGIPASLFCGILFSGRMDRARVEKVLPRFYRLACRKDRDLELLFHPGGIDPGQPFFDPGKTSFHPFYLSQGRQEEYLALHTLHFTPQDQGR